MDSTEAMLHVPHQQRTSSAKLQCTFAAQLRAAQLRVAQLLESEENCVASEATSWSFVLASCNPAVQIAGIPTAKVAVLQPLLE